MGSIGVLVGAVVCCVATSVWACEQGSELYFACTFADGAKTVELCNSEDTVQYRFGPTGGKEELHLERDVRDVHLTPWPGIGRTIWEEVTLLNKGHSYTIFGSIDRGPPSVEGQDIVTRLDGGISVKRHDIEIAQLTCDPGSVSFPWGTSLFDAKVEAGQCYERSSREWIDCKE